MSDRARVKLVHWNKEEAAERAKKSSGTLPSRLFAMREALDPCLAISSGDHPR